MAVKRLLPLVLLLAGCGASPATRVTEPGASLIPITTSGSVELLSPLDPLNPCELLSPSERSEAGLTSLGKAKPIGPTRACDWTETGKFGVTITLDGRNGLADLQLAKKTAKSKKVGSHQALEAADRKAGDGTCAVLLGVGDSASVQVDVSNTTFSDTGLACERAGTVAELIEPKLP
ncbi:Protein of unknown function [Amycolatopsis xylanica]|uniref:DUF3558 domain-containing protein n=1 Tax=Amycolatopsis xylanica TaxID=589385 RepID=A0A1H3GED7_9PSEU|nr:Protein of unknown function [Amycolatopsis xylanica]